VRATFLYGPAGSGKTHRCLSQIRERLRVQPLGPPLLLLAPRQATYQLERQLLADPTLPGYTRLQILSLPRLAQFVLDLLAHPVKPILGEEGRLMVLRALLARHRDRLSLFRASSRLPGFARQLDATLRELQHHQVSVERLERVAASLDRQSPLAAKLRDLAVLGQAYAQWLEQHGLEDPDRLLDLATEALRHAPGGFQVEGIWMDGFAEMTPQELDLVAAVVRGAGEAQLAFCVDHIPTVPCHWLSPWATVTETSLRLRERLEGVPGVQLQAEYLGRNETLSRFANAPALQYLSDRWSAALSPGARGTPPPPPASDPAVRVLSCETPEAEAIFAAREVLRHVQAGGRYREVAVLVRSLTGYGPVLRRVFARYEIPHFIDQRQSVAHHPLAELTLRAIRMVAFGWQHQDWFGALKSGLAGGQTDELDRLENAALAHGWAGDAWLKPLPGLDTDPALARMEAWRAQLTPPFVALQTALRAETGVTGHRLAAVVTEFWQELAVSETLERWGREEPVAEAGLHQAVWEQLATWLENVALAFGESPLTLGEWIPVLEAGLGSLTLGIVPPVLDQVLIGAVDRSRNPDLRWLVLLGFNEGLFPAVPSQPRVLTEIDRDALASAGLSLGPDRRRQLSRERYLAYIALTRARERLLITHATNSADGTDLNPSPFLAVLHGLFPSLRAESFALPIDWREARHPRELLSPALTWQPALPTGNDAPAALPVRFRAWLDAMPVTVGVAQEQRLDPAVAAALHRGQVLRTSTSRLEWFAACPFKHFVSAELRAQERLLFEVDSRQRGSLQHEILQRFHESVRAEGLQWRDLTPDDAAARVARIAETLTQEFADGLFAAEEDSVFTARTLSAALQRLIRQLVEWMRDPYRFAPALAERSFGQGPEDWPAWEVPLAGNRVLALRGQVDRVDLCMEEAGGVRVAIIDYKSSEKKVDRLLLEAGVQMQPFVYLNALTEPPLAERLAPGQPVTPAGAFYLGLRGQVARIQRREEVERAKNKSYRHQGRFRADLLACFDRSASGAKGSGQFATSNRSQDPLPAGEFAALLAQVKSTVASLAARIFDAEVSVLPYAKGNQTACDYCEYGAICRFDPQRHRFRQLVLPANAVLPGEEAET
jgi:ATP-dependent helicase/nuclease subunit B